MTSRYCLPRLLASRAQRAACPARLIAAGLGMAFFPLFSLRTLPAVAAGAIVFMGLRSRLNSTSGLAAFTTLAAIAAALSAPLLLSWVSLWWILGAVALLLWRRTPATFLLAAAALLMGWTSWHWWA
ncbi:hypothetical protein ACTXMG_11605 [Corynebacterium flavescens]|uniref:hypothetical protein n=1 Tax=Corynebacterium flavescens TaxID=28028 RepID=UPI003FD42545